MWDLKTTLLKFSAFNFTLNSATCKKIALENYIP